MWWLVNFIAYVGMIEDLPTRSLFYRMALYHLWELYDVFNRDFPSHPQLYPVRAVLAMWRDMIHSSYQLLRIQMSQQENRPIEGRCSCALCVPPREHLFTPEYFWQIWNLAKLHGCHCSVCRNAPSNLPHGLNRRNASTQTESPAERGQSHTPVRLFRDASSQTITRPPPLQRLHPIMPFTVSVRRATPLGNVDRPPMEQMPEAAPVIMEVAQPGASDSPRAPQYQVRPIEGAGLRLLFHTRGGNRPEGESGSDSK